MPSHDGMSAPAHHVRPVQNVRTGRPILQRKVTQHEQPRAKPVQVMNFHADENAESGPATLTTQPAENERVRNFDHHSGPEIRVIHPESAARTPLDVRHNHGPSSHPQHELPRRRKHEGR